MTNDISAPSPHPRPRPGPRPTPAALPVQAGPNDAVEVAVEVPGGLDVQQRRQLRSTSYALLGNTIVTSVFGWAYWVFAARTFSAEAVGAGAAIISSITLISAVGSLNLTGLAMRFLPTAGARSRQLVVGIYALACVVSAVIAVAVYGIFHIADLDSPLNLPLLAIIAIAVGVLLTCVFQLEDGVLAGLRAAAPWVPLENGTYGALKLALLMAFSGLTSAYALVASWLLPLLVIVPLINALLFLRLLPSTAGHGLRRPVRASTRSQLSRFVRGDAASGLFQITWTNVLPIVVTTTLGVATNSRFYVAFLFVISLDLVATNFTSALTVESSYHPDQLSRILRVTARRVFLLLIPVDLALVAGASTVLHVYGGAYVSAAGAMQLMVLACLPRALVTLYYGVCRVRRQTYRTALVQGVSCVSILVAAWIASSRSGLVGVGWSLLAVHTIVALAIAPALWRAARVPTAQPSAPEAPDTPEERASRPRLFDHQRR